MAKFTKYQLFLISFFIVFALFPSCKDLYETDQELEISESKLYGDWYEYRSAMMGIYGLQQELVEQLLVLGELRGDLLQITPNADADMVEVYNFNVSKTNKYASPTNFFKLIAACNTFLRNVKERHPEVIDHDAAVTNYDKIYGEALCMRAWAYFNAVRIYGKVPYIHESLTTIDEITGYVNSPGRYEDTNYIVFARDGYNNDTIQVDTTLEKKYIDIPMTINMFTRQLEAEVKDVGVNYALDNNDNTWEVTTWHPYGMNALLGHMYFTLGNYANAVKYFNRVVNNTSENYRYQLDNSFGGTFGAYVGGVYRPEILAYSTWKGIFTSIDSREHIYTIWFNKNKFQQNQFQDFFINKFMLKPTRMAVSYWETTRRNQVINEDNAKPKNSKMVNLGDPKGDECRGYLSSYLYFNSTGIVMPDDQMKMLEYKSKLDFRSANSIMDGADTVVYKYMINKDTYDQDANYIIYRAGGIHLYLAEIFNYWVFNNEGTYKTDVSSVYGLLNDGAYYGGTIGRIQKGIRGRVGLGATGTVVGNNANAYYDGIKIQNIMYIHDPNTNKIIDYIDIGGSIAIQQSMLEEKIIEERARELAFEGERFYDLMRVSKRRGNTAFLAKKVSEKFPSAQRQAMYTLLSNESNWYINYFDE